MADAPPTIAYLFTTFPKSTETFLQREIEALLDRGVRLKIYSLWGGGGKFHGVTVRAFNKWRLFGLIWTIPWVAVSRWDVFGPLVKGLMTRRPPSWLNFWENMLGAGFAGIFYREFRRNPLVHIHAAWSGAPATAAWCLGRMNKLRYSAAAHAYDVYEHGGDWWLNEKLGEAVFVHTSTEMVRRDLLARGVSNEKVQVIRRGLTGFPELKPLRGERRPLRIVCVARLVEKKGLDRQIEIYAALKSTGVTFEARIIGEGPLRASLARQAAERGLENEVSFLGHLGQPEVWAQLAWADVMLHTGVVATSGDRDGLPNVIPEAMAAGVVVVTSPAAATTEAITHEVTGLVADVNECGQWVAVLRRLMVDDALMERLRASARAWVEENFDAHKNAARLHALFEKAVHS